MWLALLLPSLVSASEPRLVVHEWGTFTSVAGDDGQALDWRPLSGPSDLPGFVHDTTDPGGIRQSPRLPTSKDVRAPIRMETPVLYFYADAPMRVSVRVDFPQGHVTEWYPQARSVDRGIDWGEISVGEPLGAPLLHDGSDSHYYPARAVAADAVRSCDADAVEAERFLFYRGIGDFAPPVRFSLDGDVRIDAPDGRKGARAVIFERQGARVGHRVVSVGDGAAPRPTLDGTVDEAVADLEALLLAQGLYADEVRAMTATWRDSWFEDGLRVLYLFTAAETEAILPLHVEPRPAELVRVMVGRAELFTPAQEADARQLTRGLAPAAAAATLAPRYGRFAEPLYERISGD